MSSLWTRIVTDPQSGEILAYGPPRTLALEHGGEVTYAAHWTEETGTVAQVSSDEFLTRYDLLRLLAACDEAAFCATRPLANAIVSVG